MHCASQAHSYKTESSSIVKYIIKIGCSIEVRDNKSKTRVDWKNF